MFANVYFTVQQTDSPNFSVIKHFQRLPLYHYRFIQVITTRHRLYENYFHNIFCVTLTTKYDNLTKLYPGAKHKIPHKKTIKHDWMFSIKVTNGNVDQVLWYPTINYLRNTHNSSSHQPSDHIVRSSPRFYTIFPTDFVHLYIYLWRPKTYVSLKYRSNKYRSVSAIMINAMHSESRES